MKGFTEEEVLFRSSMDIFGTLAIPDQVKEEKLPAIVLVAGSGPIDRDGTVDNGKFRTDLYKDLAHFFTSHGYITFRYDKRGTGKSGGEYLATGLWDLVEDAQQAVEYLKQQPQVDPNRIILAGHSEGTIIVTAVAQKLKEEIAGLMLLSGGVDNLDQALIGQRKLSYQELRSKKGPVGWLLRQLINEKKQEIKVQKQMKPVLESNEDVVTVQGFFKQPAKWFREHFAFNTREALKEISCPIIVIQGDKDPLVDHEVLKELPDLVKGPNESHIIPNMEHALKEQTSPKSILQYKKDLKNTLGKPIHPLAQEKMLNWMQTYFSS